MYEFQGYQKCAEEGIPLEHMIWIARIVRNIRNEGSPRVAVYEVTDGLA